MERSWGLLIYRDQNEPALIIERPSVAVYSYRNVLRVGARSLFSRCAFLEAAALYGSRAPASADRLPPPSEEETRLGENTGWPSPPPWPPKSIQGPRRPGPSC